MSSTELSSPQRTLNLGALYSVLDSRKNIAGLSWKELAEQLGFRDASVFSLMMSGGIPSTNALLTMTAWLDIPLDDFAQGPGPSEEERQKTVRQIERYLEQDRSILSGVALPEWAKS